mgnify:FL=1
MISKVVKTVSEHRMISSGDTVGVGLSGGADSVALLHILVTNKEKIGIKKIKAVHIHHGIRGIEADRDLDFSKKLCERLNVEFISFHINVPAEAEKTGESLEECARRLRYECFERVECDKFTTAHNLNDNAETVIFNFARGSSLSGLCGIPYTREKYIRPLLNCTREEIEAYLKENNIEYVTDSTNLSDEYTRNKIRHNILPMLFELNPSFDKAFSKCVDSVKTADDYIVTSAKELLLKAKTDNYYDCSLFENCHNAVRNQVISLILKEQNIKNISRDYISAVAHIIENGGQVSLGGNITAFAERKKLYFNEPSTAEDFEIHLELKNQQFITPVGIFLVNIIDKKDLQKLNIKNIDKFIDCDKISSDVFVRNRREGDNYKPVNRGTKTLKKLFNEAKIPVCDRSKMLILTDNEGIIWTELFGVSEYYKADETTEKFVEIINLGDK